jgi:hypothetical protein
MPKELRGIWCSKEYTAQKSIYRRCRVADGEDAVAVDARKFWVAEETVCTPLAITSDGGSHFVVEADCRGQYDDWNGRVLKRWRLFNSGRRLEIRDANINHQRAQHKPHSFISLANLWRE